VRQPRLAHIAWPAPHAVSPQPARHLLLGKARMCAKFPPAAGACGACWLQSGCI
jgi:hypothetical protein